MMTKKNPRRRIQDRSEELLQEQTERIPTEILDDQMQVMNCAPQKRWITEYENTYTERTDGPVTARARQVWLQVTSRLRRPPQLGDISRTLGAGAWERDLQTSGQNFHFERMTCRSCRIISAERNPSLIFSSILFCMCRRWEDGQLCHPDVDRPRGCGI